MAEASDTKGSLRQNLMDAGCDPEMVDHCMELAQAKEHAELARVLSRHRQKLLEAFHQSERRIDCLDYFCL